MMKLPSIILLLPMMILPEPTSSQCSDTVDIDLPRRGAVAFTCENKAGPVRLVWEAFGDYDDDEYFVKLMQENVELYRSGQHESAARHASPEAGGQGDYEVRFECDLEGLFAPRCDDGDFSFKIVDCGCPLNTRKVSECTFSSVATASDAVCVPVCEPGRFLGNGQCNECPTGQFQDEQDQIQCKPCPPGTFQDSTGQTSCKKCPAGEVQEEEGQTQCDPIPISTQEPTQEPTQGPTQESTQGPSIIIENESKTSSSQTVPTYLIIAVTVTGFVLLFALLVLCTILWRRRKVRLVVDKASEERRDPPVPPSPSPDKTNSDDSDSVQSLESIDLFYDNDQLEEMERSTKATSSTVQAKNGPAAVYVKEQSSVFSDIGVSTWSLPVGIGNDEETVTAASSAEVGSNGYEV